MLALLLLSFFGLLPSFLQSGSSITLHASSIKHATIGYSILKYFLLERRKLNLDHLLVFGCKAYCIIDKENLNGKIGTVAYEGWHLELSRYQRGWHIYGGGPAAPYGPIQRADPVQRSSNSSTIFFDYPG